MSYDLMVLDKHRRFKTPAAFIAWYDQVVEWAEGIDYNDYRHATPELQAWFMDIKEQIPPMNGEFAPSEEKMGKGNFDEADYSIARDAIYVAFAWSDAERVYPLVVELAKKHDVALFDVSGTGDVIYPDGEVLNTAEYLKNLDKFEKSATDGEELWKTKELTNKQKKRQQEYQEAYEKEFKRRNKMSGILAIPFVIAFFAIAAMRQLDALHKSYLMLGVVCALMLAWHFILRKWVDKTEEEVAKKMQQRHRTPTEVRPPKQVEHRPMWSEEELAKMERQVLDVVKCVKLIESMESPEDFAVQMPLVCTLVRMMPGSDQPDYWLAKCERPIKYGDRNIDYIVLGIRFVGGVFSTEQPTAFNIAFVTDESLLLDREIDFEKCEYVCIGEGLALR